MAAKAEHEELVPRFNFAENQVADYLKKKNKPEEKRDASLQELERRYTRTLAAIIELEKDSEVSKERYSTQMAELRAMLATRQAGLDARAKEFTKHKKQVILSSTFQRSSKRFPMADYKAVTDFAFAILLTNLQLAEEEAEKEQEVKQERLKVLKLKLFVNKKEVVKHAVILVLTKRIGGALPERTPGLRTSPGGL